MAIFTLLHHIKPAHNAVLGLLSMTLAFLLPNNNSHEKVYKYTAINNNLEKLAERFVFKNKDTLSFDNFLNFAEIDKIRESDYEFKMLDEKECKKYTDRFLPAAVVKDRLYQSYFYSFQPFSHICQPVVFYSIMDDLETLHLVTLDSSANVIDSYKIGENQNYPDVDKLGKQYVFDKSAIIIKITPDKYKIEQFTRKDYSFYDRRSKPQCDTLISYIDINPAGKIIKRA